MPFSQAVKNPRSGAGNGFSAALARDPSEQAGGFYASVNSPKKDAADLESVDGLLKLARAKGVIGADEIADRDKLSFLERLSSGLGALNPAEAIMRNYEGAESFLTAYPKDVIAGIASAVTGNDYGEQTKKRYFGDVVEAMGVENKYARFGLGLVGDILLDPSTYVGGTIARFGVKGAAKAGSTALKGVGKFLPEVEAGLRQSGQGLSDAFGSLFVFGHGASKAKLGGEAKGLAEEFLEYEGKKVNVQRALAISNAKRFGSDVLTDNQWEEFLGHLFKGKTAEFNYFDNVTDEMLEAFNAKFPDAKFALKPTAEMKKALTERLGREASDVEVRAAVRTQAMNRLESVTRRLPEKIGRLQALRDKLAKPFIADDLLGMKQQVNELKKELAELIPTETKEVAKKGVPMASKQEIDSALMNALGSAKEKYTDMILKLQGQLDAIESGVIEPAMREVTKEVADKSAKFTIEDILGQVLRKLDPTLKVKDKLVVVTKEITKLTNDMMLKQSLLEGALAGKQIAKERISKAVATGDWSSLPAELTHALNPVIGDEKVASAMTERLARNAKMAAEAGIDDPFVMYAPSIAKDVTEKARINSFFTGTRSLKVGSEAYKKEFRNLLKDSELIKDRALFLRVEDEIATNKVTREFLDRTVADYGKALTEFASEKEATAAGYRLLKDKGIFGKEVGYVLESDWRFLNSHMNQNYKALDAIAKATGFDAATSLFKRFMTGLFAPFHVRNFASGEMQNFEVLGKVAQHPRVQALGLRLGTKVSRGAYAAVADPFDLKFVVGQGVEGFGDEAVELAGKSWKLDDIGAAIEQRFGGSSRYNVDFNSITADATKTLDSGVWSKEAVKEWGKSFVSFKGGKNPVEGLIGQDALHFKAAQAIGQFIEMQQKSKLVVGALMKGMSMEEALQVAAKGGFDYRALTQFESKVMRRIMPFYSFTRKNITLQLSTLKESPQRINQIIRSIENVQNLWETNLTSEEKENLPAYLKEYLSAPVGRGEGGVPLFVRNFGTPIEAFTELVKFQAEGKSSLERTFLGMLSRVNPYIKVPVEIATDTDSFRQRDLHDVYTAPEYEHAPAFVKEFLQLKAVTKKDFVTQIPRTTYVADPERLLIMRSLFTSRGFTYFNNVFNGKADGFLKILDLASGIRVAEVDVERQAGFTERRKIEEIGDLLRRNGVLSEFNKLFIPKEK